MHTPEQALNLWCPMVRSTTHMAHDGAGNRTIGEEDPITDSHCIADRCAMWRWGSILVPPEGAEPGKLSQPVKRLATTGFCGLAGTPAISV